MVAGHNAKGFRSNAVMTFEATVCLLIILKHESVSSQITI